MRTLARQIPSSQLDAVAQPGSPFQTNRMSAAKAPIKQTIGEGTSIGWMGCPPIFAMFRGLAWAGCSS